MNQSTRSLQKSPLPLLNNSFHGPLEWSWLTGFEGGAGATER
ncbi:MAG: hypothetical protein [Olavius algarvensis Gamma 1 endosymbiont]|nr:MAG: hypothetical protein [Olavius algarvensis Gamma 1 endosymbiont]